MANEPNADDAAHTSDKQMAEMFVALAKAEQRVDNLQEQLDQLSMSSACQSIQMVKLLGMVPPETIMMTVDGVKMMAVELKDEIMDALDSIEPPGVVDQLRAGLGMDS